MDGQSFEHEFLQGVKASVAAEEKSKRKIDVRLVAALAAGAVVIVGWVVWVVVGGGGNGGGTEDFIGWWECENDMKMVFSADDTYTFTGKTGGIDSTEVGFYNVVEQALVLTPVSYIVNNSIRPVERSYRRLDKSREGNALILDEDVDNASVRYICRRMEG